MRWIFVSLLLLLLSPALLRAQDSQPSADSLRVYLITFGPGSDPWEKFGHDSIAIEDGQSSVAYNWGVFDFGRGFSGLVMFGWHFLQGRLLYSMRSEGTGDMIDAYTAAGRSILVQEIRLSPEAKLKLKARLEANDTEANRYYLYDYFKKNCATMARDQLDQATGGQIAAALQQTPTGTTYRWHDRRLSAEQLWLYFFLDYALGHPIDKPLSAWQESFLPEKFAKHLDSVQVTDASGNRRPIVVWQKQLQTGIYTERDQPPADFIYGFLVTGLSIGVLFVGLAAAGRRWWVARWTFNIAVMFWSTLIGLLGLMLTYAWISNHDAAKWNENWLHGNVISLLMIVAAPMAYRWPRFARRVAVGVLGLSLFGLLAKLTPWFWQTNGSIIVLLLPIHAGVAWGIWMLTERQLKPKAPVVPGVPAAEPLGSVLAQQG